MSNDEKRPRNWTRIARNTSAGMVASIAGYASYWHQVHVTLLAGERTELAHVIPFSVDGVLVVASVSMVDARREGRKPSWQTKLGFATGIVASVGANVMSAQPTALGRIVAAWPAIALLLVVEMLSSKGKLVEIANTITALGFTADDAQAPNLPQAPVSPGPVGAATTSRGGRPSIPAAKGPQGRMVHAETGDPLKERTERRKRNGQ